LVPNGGTLIALVLDNVSVKIFNVCIKVFTENDYDQKEFKMTYEIYCDDTNEIIVDSSFADIVKVGATSNQTNAVYVFDPKNLVTTRFVGCPIISINISLSSDVAEMVQNNCSTSPCKDIQIK
jgi:hypothetical protein